MNLQFYVKPMHLYNMQTTCDQIEIICFYMHSEVHHNSDVHCEALLKTYLA